MRLSFNLGVIAGSALIVSAMFGLFEPAVSKAVTDDVTVTQSVTSGISISSPSDITMTALSTSQNTAVGSAAWTVTTNNVTGYTIGLHASTSPALARSGGGGNIADYTPAVAETPETWSVSSGSIEFGFSAFGSHVSTGTWGTDSDCIAGSDVPSAGLKWRDFDTSSDNVGSSSSATSTSGTATTMCVATEQNTLFANSGTYTATITATAVTQ